MTFQANITSRTLETPHGEQAFKVVEKLLDNGFDAYWVGGCVRDMMLESIPDDIDIATTAQPDQIIQLFPKCDETAKDLGSIIVSEHGHSFEVTTLRKDHSAGDGRHPEAVEFTNSIEEDAARRDISINALYWNPIDEELHDFYEGKKDLSEKLIRIIGDPNTRIDEDALRLLRVIRFRALIDGQYHPDTFKALHSNAQKIEILSGVRRFTELEKMLLGPHPDIAFEDLWETDIIQYLLPEMHACKGVAQPHRFHEEGDVWEHSMQLTRVFTRDHEADVRWAGLMHDIGKPQTFSIEDDRIHFNNHASKGADIAKEVLDRLQCPGDRRSKICWLIEHHMMVANFFEMTDERKAYWYYHPWFIELLQVFWLDIAGSTPQDFSLYERLISDYNHFLDSRPRPQKPLLSGNEIMEILNLKPGKDVGRILSALHTEQIAERITQKSEARAFVEKINLDELPEETEHYI